MASMQHYWTKSSQLFFFAHLFFCRKGWKFNSFLKTPKTFHSGKNIHTTFSVSFLRQIGTFIKDCNNNISVQK